MIKVNGEPRDWRPGLTVADVLADVELKFPIYTVRLDGKIISRDRYGSTEVRNGSELDIIYIIAGG